jgi:carbonic anhydrase
MKKLVQGIIDFKNKVSLEYKETFSRLALGQSPDALFVTCSDSRVAPNLFASTDPGDLFVLRNVGNFIPPCCEFENMSVGCESPAAALEFAVLNLKVSSIIICGHSNCGAMQFLLRDDQQNISPHLKRWLENGTVALKKLHEKKETKPSPLPLQDYLSQLNVLEQINHLLSYPMIRERVDAGDLKLYGWWFDIGRTEVLSYHDEKKEFVMFDETEATRILNGLRNK